MVCYECQQSSKARDAVALCHHCSAALCAEHIFVFSDPVTARLPVNKTVVLPLQARLFLCSTCQAALQQRFDDDGEQATISTASTKLNEHEVSA